ncbi:unnamed protein product [Danaus chrysippus]|uniref:(African queen) hypothetical protein n=1 Tax=Danaus chrysippus TaxID=151541 RepID=A0A8J2R3V8_9NEOP|nr:unnamed protein product [Danaus chrysippus]
MRVLVAEGVLHVDHGEAGQPSNLNISDVSRSILALCLPPYSSRYPINNIPHITIRFTSPSPLFASLSLRFFPAAASL